MLREKTKTIEETVKSFFEKMTVEVEVTVSSQGEDGILVSLRAAEPKILIGEAGQTLTDLQRILRLIICKKMNEVLYIDVDVNGYKKAKTDYLRKTAQAIADEVALSKKDKALPSMSSYERRIVHVELSNRTDIICESVGEEPNRQILIKSVSRD